MNKILPMRNIQRKKINHYTALGIVIYLPLKGNSVLGKNQLKNEQDLHVNGSVDSMYSLLGDKSNMHQKENRKKQKKEEEEKCVRWTPVLSCNPNSLAYNGKKDAQILISMNGDEVTAFRGHPHLPTGEGVLPIHFVSGVFALALCQVGQGSLWTSTKKKKNEEKKSMKFSVFIGIFFFLILSPLDLLDQG